MLELALVVRVSELTVGVPPWCLIPSIPCPSGLRVSCGWQSGPTACIHLPRGWEQSWPGFLRACRFDAVQQRQGPSRKVSEGKRAGTPWEQIWRRNGKWNTWKVTSAGLQESVSECFRRPGWASLSPTHPHASPEGQGCVQKSRWSCFWLDSLGFRSLPGSVPWEPGDGLL